MKIPVGLS